MRTILNGRGKRMPSTSWFAGSRSRIAEPEDIAPVVTFLLSPAGAYLTGTEISADGGVLAAIR